MRSLKIASYCPVGHPMGASERAEVFASGRSAFAEDFKAFGRPTKKTRRSFFLQMGYGADALAGARATITCLAMLAFAP
ncbi:MAG: hypothetical protein IT353_24740 [Gemmatimonadaceae bacterium]|nr:hypothetical protein [Gemmatimonadaceae bacterium]